MLSKFSSTKELRKKNQDLVKKLRDDQKAEEKKVKLEKFIQNSIVKIPGGAVIIKSTLDKADSISSSGKSCYSISGMQDAL